MLVQFIDIQGLPGNDNEFIVKEVGILKEDGAHFEHRVMLPPYELDALEENIRNRLSAAERYIGFAWNSGETPYEELIPFLQQNISTSPYVKRCVKGVEKCKWLRKWCNCEFFDMEIYGCPSLGSLSRAPTKPDIRCSRHWGTACVIKNIFNLHTWYHENRTQFELFSL